jgi:putative inorganic carbon (HCO3(-)) transporter
LSVQGVLLAAFVAGLGLSITLAETALALLTVRWLWALRDGTTRAATRWPLWRPVLAWSAVTVLSALLSGHAVAGLEASKSLLLVVALYVTANALRDAGAADRFLSALSVAVALAAVVGLLQVGLCPGGRDAPLSPRWLYHRCDRAHGFFSIYMTLAGILTLVLLATLPRVLPGVAAFRRWAVVPWLISLGALVATFTRGAWLGFAAGVLALLPALRRAGLVVVAGLLALVVGLLAVPGDMQLRLPLLYELRHRLTTMADPEESGVRERVYMWRSGLAIWREHPWLGIGPGGVKRVYERYARPEAVRKHTSHVHNTPLQILVERGVVGLVAWLWIWVAFFTRVVGLLRRLPAGPGLERALALGSLAGISGFLVGGLSEYNFGDSEVVMVAWVVAALPFATQDLTLAGVKEKNQPLTA